MNDWTKKSLASPGLCIVDYCNHTETLKSMVGTQINKINVLSRYSIQLSKSISKFKNIYKVVNKMIIVSLEEIS